MCVDRALRDKMADAIIAYMQGRIKARELEKVTGRPSKDKGAMMVGWQVWYFYDDFIDHPICVTRECWACLRRWVAFLKTDYGLTEMPPPFWACPRVVPALFLAGLSAILAASIAFGSWVVLMVAWPILALAWYPIRRLKIRRDRAILQDDAEFKKLANVAPFLSAEDWKDHEALLASCQIPQYDAAIHYKPFRDERTLRRMWARFGGIVSAPLIACVIWLPFMLIGAFIAGRTMNDDATVLQRTGRRDAGLEM